MHPDLRQKLEPRADIFKALGHTTRLLIVEELASGPRNVTDLTALAGADGSTVSRHLAVLRRAGILSSEKQGAEVIYSLRVPCVMEFLTCVERVIAADGGEGR